MNKIHFVYGILFMQVDDAFAIYLYVKRRVVVGMVAVDKVQCIG